MSGGFGGGINIGPGGISGGIGGGVNVGGIGISGGVNIGPGGISGGISVNLPTPFFPGLFRPANRRIGGIIAQVTIEEQERDELTITEFPVEQGAPISDHAFKRPSEVSIRAGWSMAVAGDLSANGGGVYSQLLSWQASLQPFDLVTGKRTYKDMLIQTLTVTTDQHSEFALMAEIHCRQVIIVKTQVTQAATSGDPQKQADPSNTKPAEKGDQQPKEVGPGKPAADPELAGPSSPGVFGQAGGPDPETAFMNPPSATGTQVEKTVQQNTTPEQQSIKTSGGGLAGVETPVPPPIISP